MATFILSKLLSLVAKSPYATSLILWLCIKTEKDPLRRAVLVYAVTKGAK